MGKEKKKNRLVFPIVTLSIAALSIGIAIASPIVADYFSPTLDNYIGRGKVINDEGSEKFTEEEKDYYNRKYEVSTDGKIQASIDGYKVTEEIADEGIVLLKNNNHTLPLAKNSKVTPLGYRYLDPIMTGTGSGAATLLQSFVIDAEKGLHNHFDVNSKFEEKMKTASPSYATSSGYKGKADQNGTFSGATSSVAEFDPSIYSASDIGDYKTAIVYIGRQGGEGDDLQMTPYYSDPYGINKIANHQLQLMPYEKKTIQFAEENFDHVIVVLNSPNPMEIKELKEDDKIGALLWIGTTGSRGMESLGKILDGEVNPSGRLVDTYYADFTQDPTFNNFGPYFYSNAKDRQFTEYEEGVYVGYKYYETRYGNEETEYNSQVVYPLGYGLHYDGDKVTQTLDSVIDQDGTITVKGTVRNDSDYDVKESVQIYYGSPYHTESKIEKSDKNLIDFTKVDVKKGESRPFELRFQEEDLASYDYQGYYTDGKGSYVLESGSYPIYLGKNAHESYATQNIEIPKTIVYSESRNKSDVNYVGKRSSDLTLATNQYEELNDYMLGKNEIGSSGKTNQLTRENDFAKLTSSPKEKSAPQILLDRLTASDKGSDYSDKITSKYGTEAPVSGKDNNLTLSDLRGLDYGDPKWNDLLDQLKYTDDDLKQLLKLFGQGSFNTAQVSSIGKPQTSESDGPQAIGKTGVSDGTGAANAYTGEVLTAATWNKDCAKKMGNAIGEEALTQHSNGWYAPACNIHRSPFEGRLYEYYSEDPILSGYMAMYTVVGASEKGYTPYIKHFAINEQENGRSNLATWVNEQALRETYLKPFEMAIKYGEIQEKYLGINPDTGKYEVMTKQRKAATGLMASLNRIGTSMTCTDYSLLTTILRKEWGFEGHVISDSYTPINNQLLSGLEAGCDSFLSFMKSNMSDTTSVVSLWSMRQAVHDISYAAVNSNTMEGVGPSTTYHYGMSPWWWYIILIDVVFGGAAIVLIGFNIRRFIQNKKKED